METESPAGHKVGRWMEGSVVGPAAAAHATVLLTGSPCTGPLGLKSGPALAMRGAAGVSGLESWSWRLFLPLHPLISALHLESMLDRLSLQRLRHAPQGGRDPGGPVPGQK